MKRFMLLHFGFEKPTPEIMAAWGKWFESVADKTVEHGGFSAAREVSHGGTEDLPMAMDSITGYSIVNAESLEEAEKVARDNPFIASIRVYEIRPERRSGRNRRDARSAPRRCRPSGVRRSAIRRRR